MAAGRRRRRTTPWCCSAPTTRPGDLRRVALYPGTGLRTPLGVVPIDQALQAALLKEPDTAADATPHAKEHSIEVHLPFVQRLFPKATIVAAVVPAGGGRPRAIRPCAREAAGRRRALIVASSDLSHYPSARDAGAVDRRTLEAMATLDVDRFRAAADGQLTRGVHEPRHVRVRRGAGCRGHGGGGRAGRDARTPRELCELGRLPVGDSDRVVGYGADGLLDRRTRRRHLDAGPPCAVLPGVVSAAVRSQDAPRPCPQHHHALPRERHAAARPAALAGHRAIAGRLRHAAEDTGRPARLHRPDDAVRTACAAWSGAWPSPRPSKTRGSRRSARAR